MISGGVLHWSRGFTLVNRFVLRNAHSKPFEYAGQWNASTPTVQLGWLLESMHNSEAESGDGNVLLAHPKAVESKSENNDVKNHLIRIHRNSRACSCDACVAATGAKVNVNPYHLAASITWILSQVAAACEPRRVWVVRRSVWTLPPPYAEVQRSKCCIFYVFATAGVKTGSFPILTAPSLGNAAIMGNDPFLTLRMSEWDDPSVKTNKDRNSNSRLKVLPLMLLISMETCEFEPGEFEIRRVLKFAPSTPLADRMGRRIRVKARPIYWVQKSVRVRSLDPDPPTQNVPRSVRRGKIVMRRIQERIERLRRGCALIASREEKENADSREN
jgi:hypothetical protein